MLTTVLLLLLYGRILNRRSILICSWLSLSRLRLSQITAYLEVKIWSLFLHGNLTTGNKILWKREEIAQGAISPLFHNIFNKAPITGVELHIHLWNVVVLLFFPHFCKSDISSYSYLEVFKRVPWTEITRVDCMFALHFNTFSLTYHMPILFPHFSSHCSAHLFLKWY